MSKKRTITETELQINSVHTTDVVPVATFFNGFESNNNTKFGLYQLKHMKNLLLHADDDNLIYEAKSDTTQETPDLGSNYYVAIYDSKNKKIDLFKSTPILNTKVIPKSKYHFNGPSIRQHNLNQLSITKRNELGQEFGTKRAKKMISNLAANKIDSDNIINDKQDNIVESLKHTTEALPTLDEMTKNVTNDRPTPKCNVSAVNTEDIYPITNIIPTKEYNMIRVDFFLSNPNNDSVEDLLSSKLQYLPFSNSKYVKEHLTKILNSKTNKHSQVKQLKLLYYVSLLFGTFEYRRSTSNKQVLLEKLNEPSELLVDGILSRFTTNKFSQKTNTSKNNKSLFIIDPYHEDKLLCYLLILILHIDNFSVLIPPLAQELSLKPSKLTSLFRAIGCQIKPLTVTQAEAYNLSRNSVQSYKVASLKVPFKEPTMVRRGARS